MSICSRLGIALLCSLICVITLACEWDYDTRRMEQQTFPSIPGLITGEFLRHSPEFYRWRIQDRQKRLKQGPRDLALYDDLAVAYDKTGQQDLAIKTILEKDKLQPGRYETQANHGTFLIHSGKLREGLDHLQKAIEINPDAHFGRERYQMLLVEYVLSRQVDGKTPLPLAELDLKDTGDEATSSAVVTRSFIDFMKHALDDDDNPARWSDVHRDEALQGVTGMMKFGSYDSPVLLEALADVLLDMGRNDLAARAYLKAAIEAKDSAAKRTYRLLARRALAHPRTGEPATEEKFALFEQAFEQELEHARVWYDDLHAKELGWIRDGKNADAEFDRLYENPPEPASQRWVNPSPLARPLVQIGLASLLALLLGSAYYLRRRRPGKKPLPSPYVK